MLHEVNNNHDTTITPLLGGILQDARALLRQEIALLRSETKQELGKVKTAGIYVAIGSGLSLAGIILFFTMIAHLLSVRFPVHPIWVWYGVVTLFAGGAAALFLSFARAMLRSTNKESLT